MKKPLIFLLISLFACAPADDQFSRIDNVMEEEIEDGGVAGAVALVAKDGAVRYHKAFGFQDKDDNVPMTTSTLFRIASMTKAITTTAAMILWEEGKFMFSDPVAEYIPAYGEMTVRTVAEDGTVNEVPAESHITVKHLLTHTSGLSYHWNSVVGKDYDEAQIGAGLTADQSTTEEDILSLAAVPLVQEPGSAWHYGLNQDALGYLIEVWSGMPFQDFLQQRIFDPLEMDDTGFTVRAADLDRLASVYHPDEAGVAVETDPDEDHSCGADCTFRVDYPWKEKAFYSGGGGLISTSHDYYSFLQMLASGGVSGGERLLSKKAVELMSTDQMPSLGLEWAPGQGFGLGFGIDVEPMKSGTLLGKGSYWWGGFFYTRFWIDPENDVIAVLMTQLWPNSHQDLSEQFENAVYQSL